VGGVVEVEGQEAGDLGRRLDVEVEAVGAAAQRVSWKT
jgi:hypothetical protein